MFVRLVKAATLSSIWALLVLSGHSLAGVYNADTEVIYKEYWISHDEFTGGCGVDAKPPPSFYFEPSQGCTKTVQLDIPDDFSQAIKAEIYIDLWRNRDNRSALFSLNGNTTTYVPDVGSDWSRTPYVAQVFMSELVQGINTFSFGGSSGQYHVHDVAIRIYYDGSNPLIAGPGSDVTPPTGQLTTITAANGTFAPQAGGVLVVDNDQLTFAASSSDADYIEFHGYYYGYDEDNDAEFIDWHNIKQNSKNPGQNGTIDHIGTDGNSPWTTTWNIPHIPNQSGVRFKLRIVDGAGNVRETAGGPSAEFTLQRSQLVESYLIHKFEDAILHHAGDEPDIATRFVYLPADLSDVTEAYLVGAYWKKPLVSLNGNPTFSAFPSGTNEWQLAVQPINVAELVPGENQIDYLYVGSGFGHFIEKPGPMIVLKRNRSPAPAAGVVEDEFADLALDSGVWSYIDPLGQSTLSLAADQLSIALPAGVNHNVWQGEYTAPRIMQPVADTDFDLEVKFNSSGLEKGKARGILIQEDENEFLRFSFDGNDTNVRLFRASMVDSIANGLGSVSISDGNPLYMRVKREGDSWTQSYSYDGLNWTSRPAFTHAISVRSVGIYFGNASSGGAPAYTGSIDYFRNASPTSPSIVGPTDQLAIQGSSATFTVTPAGTSPFNYQWRRDGVDIPGATDAVYSTPSVTAGDNGATFEVTVTNIVGSVTSSPASLTVVVPVTISSSPIDQTVSVGESATFTVIATGDGPLTYQWQQDGSDIAGATAATYTTPLITLAENGAVFTVVVSNVAGSVTSAPATLNVNAAPVISGTPSSSVAQGSAYSFIPTATDAGDVLVFSIANQPGWAGFNSATGELSGTPGNADVGTTTGIVITVDDQQGQSNSTASLAAFNVTVTNVNDAPVISGTPSSSVAQGSAYSFVPTATDVDAGDVLVFSIANKPGWAGFNSATGELSGTPGNADVGTTTGIVITVDDQQGQSNSTASLAAFNVTVTNVNDVPVITSSISDQSAMENVAFGPFDVSGNFSDPDGDVLTFTISGLPAGSGLSISGAGVISGTPVQADAGASPISITVTATDASLSVADNFVLTVAGVDSNGDGLSDAQAIALGLDPTDVDGDTDNDGLSDVTEVGDPNAPFDNDSDGVIDALEAGATAADASVANNLSVASGTVEIVSASQLLSGVSAGSATNGPSGVTFPFGVVTYTTSAPVGGSQTVRMTFSETLPSNLVLYKVDNAGVYTRLPVSIWNKVDAKTIDVTLTDGDALTDLDQVADGKIEDPLAVGDGGVVSSGGGGGGGCTLNTRADRDPTLPVLMLLWAGYVMRRRIVK